MAFLPEKLIAVDCEMTGVVTKRDDLLQVAMVKCELKDNQYVPGDSLVIYLHTDKKPTKEFDFKYLQGIFKKCNESMVDAEQAKQAVHDFLGDWKGKVMPFGDCVPTDVAFLLEKGLADCPDIGDEGPITGTFHYEFFEMNGIKALAREKTGKKEDLGLTTTHDALQDCFDQLSELNYYLSVLLG